MGNHFLTRGYPSDRTAYQFPNTDARRLDVKSVSNRIVALALLPWTEFAVGLSLLFGLIGTAPAGIILALTAQSMTPHGRAFGSGVFVSSYFSITTPAPGIAGWLYDATGIAYWPIVFVAALFLLAGVANAAFQYTQTRLPQIVN